MDLQEIGLGRAWAGLMSLRIRRNSRRLWMWFHKKREKSLNMELSASQKDSVPWSEWISFNSVEGSISERSMWYTPSSCQDQRSVLRIKRLGVTYFVNLNFPDKQRNTFDARLHVDNVQPSLFAYCHRNPLYNTTATAGQREQSDAGPVWDRP